MAAVVYVLCALTSIACALLLFRSYRATRGGLTLGGAICFTLLALENVVLLLDRVVLPGHDLLLLRQTLGLLGPAVFVAILVWEAE